MKQLLVIIFLCFSASLTAQSLKIDGDEWHWEYNAISAGLNSDGWQIDFGMSYFPVEYVGFKLSVGSAGEIKPISNWNFGYDDYYYEDDERYPSRFKFIPALVLRTPRLIKLKSEDAGIYLFAEPGFILSPGARGSRNAEYSNWDLRTGINLQIDRLIIFVGYGISDYKLYSGFPDYRQHGLTHSGFIGSSWKF